MRLRTEAGKALLRGAVLITSIASACPLKAQQWIEVISPTPAPRDSHTAVLDVRTDRMIIFGGEANGQANLHQNDVWVLSHAITSVAQSSWVQLQPAGTPPAPRLFHSAVYDEASNRMIVFGG